MATFIFTNRPQHYSCFTIGSIQSATRIHRNTSLRLANRKAERMSSSISKYDFFSFDCVKPLYISLHLSFIICNLFAFRKLNDYQKKNISSLIFKRMMKCALKFTLISGKWVVGFIFERGVSALCHPCQCELKHF